MSDPDISKLIKQMKPRKPVEKQYLNSDETEKTEKSYRTNKQFKSTVKDLDIDYYKILGVDSTATSIEIKRAYQSKLKKYHPDHAEPTKENKRLYDLVREAGDTLTNAYEKKAYDTQKKHTENTKNFVIQKDSFKEFIKLQEQGINEESKALAKLTFDRGLAELDRKHGYDKKSSEPMTKDEYERRFEDTNLFRDQEDREIEMNTQNLFTGRNFNPKEFNKMFEQKKKRDEKRNKTQGGLAKIDGKLAAFNDFDEASGGVGLDQHDSLYTHGTYSGMSEAFAGIGAGMIGTGEMQSDDEISLDSPVEEHYESHKKVLTKDDLESKLKEYQSERDGYEKQLKGMKVSEYGSVMDDEYGISKQFGFIVGTDKYGHQHSLTKRNVKEETIKAYKKLTEK